MDASAGPVTTRGARQESEPSTEPPRDADEGAAEAETAVHLGAPPATVAAAGDPDARSPATPPAPSFGPGVLRPEARSLRVDPVGVTSATVRVGMLGRAEAWVMSFPAPAACVVAATDRATVAVTLVVVAAAALALALAATVL
jgi:hypothetical protein